MIEWLELVKVKYKIEIKQSITPHLKNLEQVNRDKDVEEREYKGLILICLDGAGFHRSKELKEYLKDNYGIFEFFRFPTYSPDLNPQEHVWKALRANLNKVKGKYTFKQTVDRACRYLSTTKFDYRFV